MNRTILIHPDGTLEMLHSDALPLAGLGAGTLRRASHVLPGHPLKRLAFITLRALFGERGRVAGWARRWRGPWEVSWAETPHVVVFTHPSRRVCIEWEIDRLNERLAS